MASLIRCALGAVLGALLAYWGTPLFRRAAISIGLMDRPDGGLKTQRESIPYLGGLAVYLAFLVAVSLAYEFSPQVLALLLAGTIALMLGLIDDFGVLSPKAKFFGQAVAAWVLIRAGIRIELTFLPDWISFPLTFFWIIGITNAFNLVDIMDGLACGIAFIGCLSLALVHFINGDMAVAFLASALAGSILGFLRYNFEPARIYLGDAGSLFLGLMIGSLAMVGRYTENSPVGALSPILILGVPIFDTLFVMYIRYRRGLSVFLGSKDHFPLRLRKWRLSVKQTVSLSWICAGLLGAVGLVLMQLSTGWGAALFLAVMVACILAAGWLKKIDMSL